MIVFNVHIKCVSILKFKRQSPVAGDLYRPAPLRFGKQQMKACSPGHLPPAIGAEAVVIDMCKVARGVGGIVDGHAARLEEVDLLLDRKRGLGEFHRQTPL
jgi:hypothetical protein